jgi:hypothetical protein
MGVTPKTLFGRLAIGVLPISMLVWPTLAAETTAIPDFSGTWGRNAFNFEAPTSGPGPIANLRRVGEDASRPILGGDPVPLVGDYRNPILKPQAAEIVRRMGEYSASGHDIPDPSNQCATYSPPYVLAMQQQVRILQTKNEVTLVYSQDDQVRRIRLNESHPAHVTPSPMGHSVGHYEGETLVVDTVGIAVGPYTVVDRFGTPQSQAMHVIERYRLIDVDEARAAQERQEQAAGRLGGKAGNTSFDPSHRKGLQIQVTVDDPNVFVTPWSGNITYRRTLMDWEERICAENNTDVLDPGFAHVPTAQRPDF